MSSPLWSAPPSTVLGCVACDFTCGSTNQMCRHLYTTLHGTARCPDCDTHIVPRAFLAGVRKLIGRSLARAADGGGGGDMAAAAEERGGRPLLVAVDSTAHPHLQHYPGLHVYEKADFVLPGPPEAYGLEPGRDATRGGHEPHGATAAATAGAAAAGAAAAGGERPAVAAYRCPDCLNTFHTWSQTAKHIDRTRHTQPSCAVCGQLLRCHGPLRPLRHEATTGHRGFLGLFYSRRDYGTEQQRAHTAFDSSTAFSGLSVLQFQCVCGVSFLHAVHLAQHLRSVHGVRSVPDRATCRTCRQSGTLDAMAEHARLDAAAAEAPDPAAGHRSRAAAAVASGGSGSPMGHDVAVRGFSAAPFLRHRPSLVPFEDTPSEAPAAAVAAASSVATGAPSPYKILYQCNACGDTYTRWEALVRHTTETNHCRAYCAVCRAFLPPLMGYHSDEGGGSCPSALAAYHKHLQAHGNIIGTPASPGAMEVLVRAEEPASVAPADQAVAMVFQCPEESCAAVYRYYGDLVVHLLETQHGRCHGGGGGDDDDSGGVWRLDAEMPPVAYRVTFTDAELVESFGWRRCAHCTHSYPEDRLMLHEELCIEYLKRAPPACPES